MEKKEVIFFSSKKKINKIGKIIWNDFENFSQPNEKNKKKGRLESYSPFIHSLSQAEKNRSGFSSN